MPVDYEAEYDNRSRVPEHPQIFQRWAREAAAFRAVHDDAELGLSYRDGPRTIIDLFWPAPERNAPITLFLHGGYWRALDPSYFSHMAAGCNAHGLACAVVGYDLCPAVTIEAIIEETRAAASFLYRRHRRRLVACGHSAGGHLTACLVATDWKSVSGDLPDNLVPAGLSISGIFDLAPLMHTSFNGDLRIDPGNARRISPLFWDVRAGRALDAWVGGTESAEFLRQSRIVAEGWANKGAVTSYREVAGANHFTVLDPLADASSELTKRLVQLAAA